jgi:isopentenyl-diphosphate delta-isomerase
MDELLDIVNDEDVVIDQQMRSAVHRLGLLHRGVHVFLYTEDGRLLVQKRSADRAASPSALDCSVSEHAKAGETYLEAALRGMQEELGVEGIEIRPIVRISMNYGPNDNEISTIFEGIIDPALVRFDPVEIEEVSYLHTGELREMLKSGRYTFCGWFVEILKWYSGEPSRLTVLGTF